LALIKIDEWIKQTTLVHKHMIEKCDHAHLAPDLSIMLSVEALTLTCLTAAVSDVILPGHTPMTIYVLSMTLNYPLSSLAPMLNCINLVLGTDVKLHQSCPWYQH